MAIKELQERPDVVSIESAVSNATEEADQNAVKPLFMHASSDMEEQATDTSYGKTADITDEQTADLSAIQPLSSAASNEPALRGNGFTYRHNWGRKRGSQKLRLNWSSVTARSLVFVAIGEGAAGGPNSGKFIGAARYTLHNVAPRNGRIDIWVDINWRSNIPLYVDYLVINP